MKRSLSVVASTAILLSLFAGCSKSDPASTSTGNAPQAQSNSGDKTTTTSGSGGNNNSPTTTSSGGDVSLPGGLGADIQKCMTLATGYAGLFLPFLTGAGSDADKAKLKTSLDDMKKQVPDNIKTDIDTIEKGINDSSSLSQLSTFLDSPDFKKADKEIQDYLNKQCGTTK